MERAIKHLKQTFSKERIYRKKEDLDALNEIISEYNRMEQVILKRNNLFIKLFIDEFLKQTVIYDRTSEGAIKEIHRLLEIPLDEYYFKMQNEIPQLRFKALSGKLGLTPLYESKEGKIRLNPEVEKKNKEIFEKNAKQLHRAITTEYSEAHLKSFLDQHLKSTILKYSNYE